MLICAAGVLLVVFGANLTIRGAPAPVLGYILAGCGALGLLDVNIFWGGPLDKRLDADLNALMPEARIELERRVQIQGAKLWRFNSWLFLFPSILFGVLLVLVMLGVI